MSARRDAPVLDRFRLLAAFLAVCNHTAPLAGLAPEADFWLTRVLARIAVPFFLMVSGYFLSQDGWRGTGRFLKRTLTLYAAAVLLYLPLNWYNGGFSSPLQGLQKLQYLRPQEGNVKPLRSHPVADSRRVLRCKVQGPLRLQKPGRRL